MVKNLPASAGDAGDPSSILGSGRSPKEGNGNPLQYSYLGNAMDRGTLVQFSSVVQSCPTLCNRLDCSMPGLSITNSQSLLKLMSIELVMPCKHLIPCCPLLLLPSIFPSIRVFSKESVLCIRWPRYWSFSFRISPSNEHQD